MAPILNMAFFFTNLSIEDLTFVKNFKMLKLLHILEEQPLKKKLPKNKIQDGCQS
jgi:hypothetical protein